jgi:hypothetical protein
MKKGDIMWAHDGENHPHPIIFIEKINNASFKAGILSSQPMGRNIRMEPSFFCENNENGIPYTIPEDKNNQYLVTEYSYIKMDWWVKSEMPEGRLTEDGIRFVESHIPDQPTLCIDSIKAQKA